MFKRGILKSIKTALDRRRIGELLVAKGLITRQDLRKALREHQETRAPLGQIFLESALISKRQLQVILLKQSALRVAAALVLFVTSFAATHRPAHANGIKDVTAQIRLVSATADFARVAQYPKLYGTDEKRSTSLKAFTKWSDMFAKFDRQLQQQSSAKVVKDWQKNLESFEGMSIKAMAKGVNDLVNQKEYITDSRNWGQSDYWATPVEFLQRGGDCEDFAIMKYTALRSLGVPEERMRLAIVQDTQKNIPHAVLVVYTESGAFILDNQIKSLVDTQSGSRYRPIYSINRTAWWLHSAPGNTIVASAE